MVERDEEEKNLEDVERNQENALNCGGDDETKHHGPSRFRKETRSDKQTLGIAFRARRSFLPSSSATTRHDTIVTGQTQEY